MLCVCVCACVRWSNYVCYLETSTKWPSRLHLALTGTRRQDPELISGPSPVAKVRLLSSNSVQSRVVTDLRTGHNTLRRHFDIMGLVDSLA